MDCASVNRRAFLRTCLALAGTAGCAAVLQACGGAPVTAPPASGAASKAASAAAAPAPSVGAGTAGLKKVRFGEVASGFTYNLSDDQGYFAEQGIELVRSRFASAVNMIAPLGSDQLDIGNGAIGAGLWNAVARGVNVKLVADAGHPDPTPPGFPQQTLLVKKALSDSGKVKSIADIKGLKVGMSVRGSSVEYAIVKMLQKGGLTMKDIDPIELPPPEFYVRMANGNIDAVFAIQPSITQILKQNIGVKLMNDYEAAPYNQSLGVLFSGPFAQSGLAVPFMIAYLKGVRKVLDGFVKGDAAAKKMAIDAVVKYGPVKDRTVFENQTSFFVYDPDGKLNVQSLNDQQDFFLQSGTQQTRLDLSKVVNTHAIDQAVAKLGPYK